ncbi:hypothetical protein IJJ05_01340 [Candidatus Saccharibacteria bacterium]|nr:hypothetical protein [Candidatus Saccharibacteria bacterium]
MGKKSQTEISTSPSPPELVRRRENRQSIFRSGRTIGEKRERLETKNERIAARKKQKRGKVFRIIFTIFCFAILMFILISLYQAFSKREDPVVTENHSLSPTIEIIDEEASSSGQITSRMKTFIARAEKEFRTLNYQPIKAVIPVGSVREVDLYLENYNGFIKMTIDRNPAVSVEDASRMLRYLNEKGISEFTYIDVRIDGKAYWK